MSDVVFRAARLADLDRIMEIDREAYSSVSSEVTATPQMMKSRIEISGDWFIIAEVDGVPWGYVSLQPTRKSPDSFSSWQDATSDGTLVGTFDPDGDFVYGVALTISPSAPRSAHLADALLVQAGARVVEHNKRGIYLSGRMPKYYKHSASMSAEEYYDARVRRDGRDAALDPQIRMYESFGLKRLRLVENGFPGDVESGGYSVVFYARNPCHGLPFPALWGWVFRSAADNETFMRHFMAKDAK